MFHLDLIFLILFSDNGACDPLLASGSSYSTQELRVSSSWQDYWVAAWSESRGLGWATVPASDAQLWPSWDFMGVRQERSEVNGCVCG